MQQVAESSDLQISTRNITGTELVCVECFHFNVSWKHGLFITPSSVRLPAATVLHLLAVALLGVALGPLSVVGIQATGLGFTVNEGTGETGDNLLGLGVLGLLACAGEIG